MDKSKIYKLGLLALVIVITCMTPNPEGLNPLAWKLFGVYLAAILGLIMKPYKEPVILLSALAISALIIGVYNKFYIPKEEQVIEMKKVLGGYASTTTWLVFSAFSLSVSFVVTGLGKRIAYLLIKLIGNSTLKLGYVNVFLELLLSPAMPSNTARAGGVVTPIFNSIALALGSDPEKSPKKAGRYLLLNVYMVTKTTSYLFLTGMAPNALALSLLHQVNPAFNLTWIQWLLFSSVPGIICLFLTPIVIYLLCPPELKKVDNKKISEEGLRELGPMSVKEKILTIVFILALLGWVFGSMLGIDSSAVAIAAMSILLITNVINWDEVLKSKGGWSTLIWYGGIIGMSGVLSQVNFFKWLGEALATQLSGITPTMQLGGGMVGIVIILTISIVIRYLFASGGAYVAAMVTVFGLLGVAMKVPYELLAIGLLFSNSYGGTTSHYGGAAAPIVMACGYNDTKSWWKIGGVIGYGTLIVHCTIGILWWKFLIELGVLN
ncbi:anion permease [Apibacter muscae]|uniref:Anion permease n=1 Tax=Apibacter muscae TaxID=2509004 RepID=A0A563DFF5_9FLAO|nr:anion permease [Apibacter muscae]TWP28663.1 anion permease [Apibacter muscae]